jgi:hypothetical protein
MLHGHISAQIDGRSQDTCMCARGSRSLVHGLSRGHRQILTGKASPGGIAPVGALRRRPAVAKKWPPVSLRPEKQPRWGYSQYRHKAFTRPSHRRTVPTGRAPAQPSHHQPRWGPPSFADRKHPNEKRGLLPMGGQKADSGRTHKRRDPVPFPRAWWLLASLQTGPAPRSTNEPSTRSTKRPAKSRSRLKRRAES